MTMMENKNMENIFIEKDAMPEVEAKAATIFAETPDAPYAEVDGVMVPNRIFFDDWFAAQKAVKLK